MLALVLLGAVVASTASPTHEELTVTINELVEESKAKRLAHLEEQAMDALRAAVENFEHPVFPNALIAGDCVITHLLGKLGYLSSGKVKIMVVDTFHMFPETMEFLKKLEEKYNFKAEVFQAEGCIDKAAYDKKYGADLWQRDIEQYDKVCKVEPFQRGLASLLADIMINGRRRDHGFERAFIDIAEIAPIGRGLAKLNPIGYWTFEDIFNYAAANGVPLHPLHAQGYPSLGDEKDTIKVPEDGSVKWVNNAWYGDKKVWLDYASERKGRFVGLQNKDGSTKTECGIHVAGAEQTFARDLWVAGKSMVAELVTREDAQALRTSGEDGLVVVYAPWCPVCQSVEQDIEEIAQTTCKVHKFRGDEDHDFVSKEFGFDAFPTINFVKKNGTVIKYEQEKHGKICSETLKQFVAECEEMDDDEAAAKEAQQKRVDVGSDKESKEATKAKKATKAK